MACRAVCLAWVIILVVHAGIMVDVEYSECFVVGVDVQGEGVIVGGEVNVVGRNGWRRCV